MTSLHLPKGELLKAVSGGPGVLDDVLIEACKPPFSGYLKISTTGDGPKVHGVIVILKGVAQMAYFAGDERLFGQKALPPLFEIAARAASAVKLHAFQATEEVIVEQVGKEFTPASIDLQAYRAGTPPGGAGSPAAATVPDERIAAARDQFRKMVGIPETATAEAEDRALRDFLRDITGIELGSVERLETELTSREEQIRKEIQRKIAEREELKMEEEKFLRLDDLFMRLLEERAAAWKEKEAQIRQKSGELQTAGPARTKGIEEMEAKVREEMSALTGEREDIKKREVKLKEMESMFRRILSNNEDRLKKKEEELLQKEDELRSEVEVRRQMLQDLREREEKLRQMEAQLLRQAERTVQDEFKAREERLRRMEEDIARRESAVGGGAEVDPELGRLLGLLDDLLGHLPEQFAESFAASEVFPVYERVVGRYEPPAQAGGRRGLLAVAGERRGAVAGRPQIPLTQLKVMLRAESAARSAIAAEARSTGMAAGLADKAIEEHRKRETELREKAEELREREAILKVEIDKMESERRDLERREKRFEDSAVAREEIEKQRKALRDQEAALTERLRELERREAARPADATEAKQRGELEKVHRELQAKLDEMGRREAELGKAVVERDRVLSQREKEVEQVRLKVTGLEGEISQLKKEAAGAKGRAAATESIAELEAEVTQLAKARDELRLREGQLRQDLDKRDAKVRELEAAVKGRTLPVGEPDLRQLLTALDELLAKLPQDDVKRFSDSPDYALYEKVMKDLGL